MSRAQPDKPAVARHSVRLNIFLVVMLLACSALLARAIDLQVVNRDFYRAQGEARYLRTIPMPAVRGRILDRNGEPLAVSTPVESAYAVPDILLDPEQSLTELARILRRSPLQLEQDLKSRSGEQFVWLRRQLDPEVADQIRALSLKGVHLQTEFKRFYPAGATAAHLLGFTNIDDQGQEGLEHAFNDYLGAQNGRKQVMREGQGNVLADVALLQPAHDGQDLTLSIDQRIQYLAYRELNKAASVNGAKSASLVMLHIPTGEVLATVNTPSYNPNVRAERVGEALRNRALTDFFEPGSVMKTFTIAAALELGEVTATTPVDTSPGYLKIDKYRIEDSHNIGATDVAGVLIKSSNVGVTKLSMDMEAQHMHDVLGRFGFGSVTATGFPGESAGIVPHYDRWRETEKATISYGYGMTVTTMQLAQAFAAIGAQGRLRSPTFIKDKPNSASAIVDPQLAQQLLLMMEKVVSEGTGTSAQISGYRVAGKTGTSRKAGPDGGYNDEYIATFAGIAPVSNPQLALVVMVDEPAFEAYYGGDVAGPVFQAVMQESLRLLGIAPDARFDPESQRFAEVATP